MTTVPGLIKGFKRRVIRKKNDWQLQSISAQVLKHEPVARTPPVIFFNASTRLSGLSLNAAYSLLSSWSLRLAGTPVITMACNHGMECCVLGTNRKDTSGLPPCKECVNQSNNIFKNGFVRWFNYTVDQNLEQLIENLSLEELCMFTYSGLPLGELVLPSMRWILRRHHLEDTSENRLLCRRYMLSASSLAGKFSKLIEEVNPCALVVFNGMFFPEATARYIAQQKGIRCITHEVGLRPNTAFFTTGQATAYPIDIPPDFELSPKQNQLLDGYLAQRFQGNFTMAGIKFWPEMQNLDGKLLSKIENFKQMVTIFTNVIFDTSQGHANQVFPHMFAWLDLVLRIIKTHPDTLFILRAHPDEDRPGKQSQESVKDWGDRNSIYSLDNLVFINSSEYVSSYELIRRSKFVMVYNSTIGLEASIMGAAVLCAGKARFTQLPTVFFPQSPSAFNSMAEDFLVTDHIDVPIEFQKKARQFLYYQIFRTSLPFDAYIQEDGFWQGYVALKPIRWDILLGENSPTFSVITNGIVNGDPFLYPEGKNEKA